MNNKKALQALASFIITEMVCHCGCKYPDSFKEPCGCGFSPIEDLFQDEFGIDFKIYPDALKKYYKEFYGVEDKNDNT